MARYDKPALAVAAALHDRLLQGPSSLDLPQSTWQRMERIHRQIERAGQRGWHAARRRLLENLRWEVEGLQGRLGRLLANIRPEASPTPPQGAAEIYRDILVLKQDFPKVVVNPREYELVVATEEIVLDGINLGPFEIQLDYGQLDLAYRAVALEPYPAKGREDVTHPHVQDDSLCEGEGRAAIRSALDEGRLGDFFLIVTRILSSYAPGRAYVELADWDGAMCRDCGATISSHDSYTCEHCNATLCEDCYTGCPQCNLLCCSECLASCDGCQESHCHACLETCPGCGKRLCPSCRDAGHQQNCENGHEHKTSPDASAAEEGTSAASAQGHSSLEPASCR